MPAFTSREVRSISSARTRPRGRKLRRDPLERGVEAEPGLDARHEEVERVRQRPLDLALARGGARAQPEVGQEERHAHRDNRERERVRQWLGANRVQEGERDERAPTEQHLGGEEDLRRVFAADSPPSQAGSAGGRSSAWFAPVSRASGPRCRPRFAASRAGVPPGSCSDRARPDPADEVGGVAQRGDAADEASGAEDGQQSDRERHDVEVQRHPPSTAGSTSSSARPGRRAS